MGFGHKKRQFYVWGGGGLATVTFLCDNSWEKSIFLLKKLWTFWKYLGQEYELTFALNSPVSSLCFSQNLYCLSSSLTLMQTSSENF